MTVLFENSEDKRREIGTANSYEEAMELVSKFLEKRNFTVHYMRLWQETGDSYFIDVGSHTEMFIVKGDIEVFERGLISE